MARRDLSTSSGSVLQQHPVYSRWEPEWRKLLDVYEGSGGFLDETRPYLAAHPREWLDHSSKIVEADGSERWDVNPRPTKPSPKLKARRKIARYENVASTLLDQLASALFRKPPDRTFADPKTIADDNPLKAFWEDADGQGRSMDAVMREFWTVSAVFGHSIMLADRDGDTAEGSTPSQADAPPVVLRGYTPIDLVDWLNDDSGRMLAVRLLEAAPREGFNDPTQPGYQVRELDDTNYTVEQVFTHKKDIPKELAAPKTEAHGFNTLPVVLLYARRRALTPFIGRSILGDPQLYIDLYNLVSEVRELLRNQTFATLNIPIGDKTGGVQSEMALVGQSAGTQNVLFSTNPSAYISPDGTNVEAYHEHIDRLIRTIYRLAVIAWEGDSKDVESAESRQLKKEDLHQMLASYAGECEEAERQICQLVYRAHYADQWESQWEKDQPTVAYPDKFDVTSLAGLLEDATMALALELGETCTKEVKKRVANELLDGASRATMEQVEKEIDALEVQTAADKEREAAGRDQQMQQDQFGHEQDLAQITADAKVAA